MMAIYDLTEVDGIGYYGLDGKLLIHSKADHVSNRYHAFKAARDYAPFQYNK